MQKRSEQEAVARALAGLGRSGEWSRFLQRGKPGDGEGQRQMPGRPAEPACCSKRGAVVGIDDGERREQYELRGETRDVADDDTVECDFTSPTADASTTKPGCHGDPRFENGLEPVYL